MACRFAAPPFGRNRLGNSSWMTSGAKNESSSSGPAPSERRVMYCLAVSRLSRCDKAVSWFFIQVELLYALLAVRRHDDSGIDPFMDRAVMPHAHECTHGTDRAEGHAG